jgi:prepilin-type N-terminal cleavage/methylation domain-containing protein
MRVEVNRHGEKVKSKECPLDCSISSPMATASRRGRGFSLVELLVVIGIIALLISMLMPALTRARAQANTVKCQANLHVIAAMLTIYQNENAGYLYPVGPIDPATNEVTTLGTNVPPNERWPMKVFKIAGVPNPLPFDPTTYPANSAQNPDSNSPATQALMQLFPAGPFTPPTLLCPADYMPYEAHSYVLNSHLADKVIKAGSHNFGGLTSDQVIIVGEKVTDQRDYYMEGSSIPGDTNTEFNRVVEKYRHGITLGSNYLYLDSHVGTVLPNEALTGLDPWDLRTSGSSPPGQSGSN